MKEQDDPTKRSLPEKTVNQQKPAPHIYGEGVRPADIMQAIDRISREINSVVQEQAYKALIEELNRPV